MVLMARQNPDRAELQIANMLAERTNNSGMSYMDCGHHGYSLSRHINRVRSDTPRTSNSFIGWLQIW